MKKYATAGGSVPSCSTNRQQASSSKTTWFSHKQKENDFRTSVLPSVFYFHHYSREITELLSVILNSFFTFEGKFCYFR